MRNRIEAMADEYGDDWLPDADGVNEDDDPGVDR